MLDRVRFLASELVLGSLIAILSVFFAYVSYAGAMADSDQNKNEIAGMKALNDGNAEYLSGNQIWIQDDSNYDNWYTNRESNPDLAEYYRGNFTEALDTAIERNGEDEYPMDETYADAVYAEANAFWEESDTAFELGSKWDERGDNLQLIALILALGIAFSAWGSLVKEESNMRLLFSALAIVMLIVGTYFFLGNLTPIV